MEEWKQLVENENYFISNEGNFKNNRGLILKQNVTDRGYKYCNIRVNNKTKKIKIHRYVAMYFIENKDNKETVNHIDGNKINNNYLNLEWMTRKENIQHGYNNNLMWNKK
jgi:hypothetical protein